MESTRDCNGNPINFTDPTGHFIEGLWKDIKHFGNGFKNGFSSYYKGMYGSITGMKKKISDGDYKGISVNMLYFCLDSVTGGTLSNQASNFAMLQRSKSNGLAYAFGYRGGEIAGDVSFQIAMALILEGGGKAGGKIKAKLPTKVTKLTSKITNWVGKGGKCITNKSGDKIFISKDGTRRVRFDINNPAPHKSPHAHMEQLVKGKWKKSGPLYPKDIPKG